MKNPELIVVLGLDEQRKPHAAHFEIVQADAVRKAAKLMGFRTALPNNDAGRDMASKLIEGKLFATGRGLVPYVKAEIYEKLTQTLELEPEDNDGSLAAPVPAPAKASSPATWPELKIGSVVIAPEKKSADDGYWPAVVVAISKDEKHLTLRWRDFHKLPPFTVKRLAIAIPVASNKSARS